MILALETENRRIGGRFRFGMEFFGSLLVHRELHNNGLLQSLQAPPIAWAAVWRGILPASSPRFKRRNDRIQRLAI